MPGIKIFSEGIDFNIFPQGWSDWHGITMCLITLNEKEYLKGLFETHKKYVRDIAIVDGGSVDGTFDMITDHATYAKKIKFGGHFANQKNRCVELVKTDWVLFLDADERLSKKALEELSNMINQDEYDCYAFPRKNFIDGVPDDSHGLDHQLRLFRTYCRFIRPVHEELVGFKKLKTIDIDSGIFIEHHKNGERHEHRNGMYGAFECMHMYELGKPGEQLEGAYKDKFKHYFQLLERMSHANPEENK